MYVGHFQPQSRFLSFAVGNMADHLLSPLTTQVASYMHALKVKTVVHFVALVKIYDHSCNSTALSHIFQVGM